MKVLNSLLSWLNRQQDLSYTLATLALYACTVVSCIVVYMVW